MKDHPISQTKEQSGKVTLQVFYSYSPILFLRMWKDKGEINGIPADELYSLGFLGGKTLSRKKGRESGSLKTVARFLNVMEDHLH